MSDIKESIIEYLGTSCYNDLSNEILDIIKDWEMDGQPELCADIFLHMLERIYEWNEKTFDAGEAKEALEKIMP